MDSVTNTPAEGTGEALTGAAAFKTLLDSEVATPEIEHAAQEEATEGVAEHTSEDEVVEDVEHPETDSEDVVDAETEDAGDEAEVAAAVSLKDDDLVDVNGEKMTFKELREGALRRDQFTKKMQEVAEQRKEWLVVQKDLQTVRAEVSERLDPWLAEASKVFIELDQNEPDWEAEWELDPYEARKKEFAWKKMMAEKAAKLKEATEYKAIVAAQEEKLQKEHDRVARIEARQSLQTLLPEQFGNDQSAQENLALITDFLRDFGYEDDVISGIRDPKAIAIAYHAMMNIQTAKKAAVVVKKVNETVPRIPTKTTASKTSKTSTFDQKLRDVKSGRAESQALFKHLLDNE